MVWSAHKQQGAKFKPKTTEGLFPEERRSPVWCTNFSLANHPMVRSAGARI